MYLPKGIPNVLLHLICRFPFLVVPIGIAVFLITSQFDGSQACLPQAMVTFSFDDGYESVYQNAYPVLQRYGYVGTIFAIPAAIGQDKYLTWPQLEELYKSGWEIASHGLTHRDLTQLNDQEIEDELIGSKEILQAHGFYVISFASPYDQCDERTISLIRKHYLVHRSSIMGLNPIPLPDDESRYYLKAIETDNISLDQIKSWIIKAKEEKKWIILIFHRIGESGQYNISLEDFEEIVRFVYDLGFQGIRFDQILSTS